MPDYRRAIVPGGTFFFTVVTENRAPIFAHDDARVLLREAMAKARLRMPFIVDAIVVLPDHIHTIWTLPKGDTDFLTRWSMLKRTFSTEWVDRGREQQPISESRRKNRRLGVWQRRFWEHTIRDDRDFERHCDYIHYNPVKHGVAVCPHAWPASSFDRFVHDGYYGNDWCCVCGGRSVRAPSFDRLAATAME